METAKTIAVDEGKKYDFKNCLAEGKNCEKKRKMNHFGDINIISIKNMREKPMLKPINGIFLSPGGKIQCIGKFNTVTKKDKKYYLGIYVIKCEREIIYCIEKYKNEFSESFRQNRTGNFI